jgi:copper transport protein
VGKVGLLAGVLIVAWQSRRLVPRIAAQTGQAAARLRGLVLAETGGIAIVLAVAAVLVQIPPARSADLSGAGAEQTVLLEPVKIFV